MTERAIAVGDLVQVVRGHSCLLDAIGGQVYVVDALNPPQGGGWHCPVCKQDNAGPDEIGAHAPWMRNPRSGIPLSWLKRIPPLDELESTKTDEPMKEPA